MTLNIATFRSRFSEFGSSNEFSDDELNSLYEIAIIYCVGSESWREYAQQLMLAHLLKIQELNASGNAPRQIASASESSVSVSVVPPSSTSDLSYWYQLTTYGQQIAALYRTKAPEGYYPVGRLCL